MGSMHFVRRPTVALDSIDMMVCLDLVGHAVGPADLPAGVRQSVFVLGAERSRGTGLVVDGAPAVPGVVPRRIDNDFIPPLSDYHAFDLAGVPFLFLSAGRWQHYHRPTDTAEKLDFGKMGALVTYLTGLLIALAGREDETRFDPRGTRRQGLRVVGARAGRGPGSLSVRSWPVRSPDCGAYARRLPPGKRLTPEERAFVGATLAGLEQGLAG